jgi:hypothetical protein
MSQNREGGQLPGLKNWTTFWQQHERCRQQPLSSGQFAWAARAHRSQLMQ